MYEKARHGRRAKRATEGGGQRAQRSTVQHGQTRRVYPAIKKGAHRQVRTDGLNETDPKRGWCAHRLKCAPWTARREKPPWMAALRTNPFLGARQGDQFRPKADARHGRRADRPRHGWRGGRCSGITAARAGACVHLSRYRPGGRIPLPPARMAGLGSEELNINSVITDARRFFSAPIHSVDRGALRASDNGFYVGRFDEQATARLLGETAGPFRAGVHSVTDRAPAASDGA